MQNPSAPKGAAVTYAVLTLVARLVDSQCDIIGLWFGRRAYERSRGEMITMLYEKTLSRKVVSPSVKKEEDSVSTTEESIESIKQHPDAPKSFLHVLLHFIRSSFRILQTGSRRSKEVEKKEPASMGKILNLMRYIHGLIHCFLRLC